MLKAANWWRLLLALAALALALALLDAGWWRARSAQAGSLSQAQWIWARDSARQAGPVAFLAVRDFELSGVVPEAELLIAVDQEYQLHLNGRYLGGGRYQLDQAMNRYAVGDLLEPGLNRIVVEARSSVGAGGILAALVDPGSESPQNLLVSDGDWSIVRGDRFGLREGLALVQPAEPSQVWGAPPTGRWGRPTVSTELRSARQWSGPWRQHAVSEVEGCRGFFDQRQIEEKDEVEARAKTELSVEPSCSWCCPLVRVDLDAEEVGALELELERVWRGGRQPVVWLDREPSARVRVSIATGISTLEPAEPDSVIMPLPGSDTWRLAGQRRFRTAWIAGVAVRGARVLRAAAPPVETELDRITDEGVWGLPLPRSES